MFCCVNSESLISSLLSWTSTYLTSDINKEQYFFWLLYEHILGRKVKAFLKERYITPIAFSNLQSWSLHHKRKLERSDITSPSYGWVDYYPIFFVNLGIQRIKTHTKTIFFLKCKAAQILCAISLLDSYFDPFR